MLVLNRLVFYISVVFLMNSCSNYVPPRVKKDFTYCFNPALDYSNSKVKFNGYFVKTIPFQRPIYNNNNTTYELDTIYSNIMFFKNGIFVERFKQLGCGNCDIAENTQFLMEINQDNVTATTSFYDRFNWGIYLVNLDTIKTQSVNHQTWPNPYWNTVEVWYKIVDNETLVEIYGKNLSDNRKLPSFPSDSISYHFIETNLSIKPDTWLKKEKWFWCDEKEFEKFIQKK